MRIDCLFMDRTAAPYLEQGLRLYTRRLERYVRFTITELPSPARSARLRPEELCRRQGEVILRALTGAKQVYRLDAGGQTYSSEAFAKLLERHQIYGPDSITLVVGGAYGFSQAVREAVPEAISLSPMTFSHQMVRLILLEQLYRAFTIIRGEPYHHQ